MSLAAGDRLGPYEVVGPLGAGGMGVVWRARDTRLDRTVAIKALPDAFAHDPERLARFEREAKLLASLTHPNIAAIYGLEEGGGHRHLVLEYVEGDTLADRLRRGAMRIEDALDACRQIAAALESAHESGVIHRDLKPGNVKITPAGEIKVLDFGLAKGAAGDASGAGILTQSPTMTLGMTGAGVILGTAAYMSPEQARGRALDRRTDIWSFGCVLYECLTGRMTFEGETVSDMIARILEREPDWSALPANTPAAVRELLQRCLEKDAKQRLRDIGDARLTLERAIAERTSSVRAATAKPRAALPIPALAIAALAGAAIGIGAWMAVGPSAKSTPPGAALTRLTVVFPESARIVSFRPTAVGLVGTGAPGWGGLWLADPGENPRLYRRPADATDWVPIAGTEGTRAFEVSPDGRWLVFRARLSNTSQAERLSRVPADGSSPPVAVMEWDRRWHSFTVLNSGEILLVDEQARNMGLIPAAGGAPVVKPIQQTGPLAKIRDVQTVLPGDRAVLFDASLYRERGWSLQTVALDPRTARLSQVLEEGGNARFRDGILLFSRGDVLLGAPFDLRALRTTAPPVALERGLRSPYVHLAGEFDLDAGGNLYTVPGGLTSSERRLAIVGTDGAVTPLDIPPAPYQLWPSPSRDGSTFTIQFTNAQGIDEIWLATVGRPGLRRVISWPDADASFNALSPDGRTLAYLLSGDPERSGVYVADVNAPGNGRRIVAPESSGVRYDPEAWSPDGRFLTLSRREPSRTNDLWLAELTPARDSVVRLTRLTDNTDENFASDFSPDGRWLAWECRATGRAECYVASLSSTGELGRPIRITDDGANVPEWFGDGRRLAVRALNGSRVDIVDVGSPPGSAVGPRRLWFDARERRVNDFILLEDGRAVAVLRGEQERFDIPQVDVIQGWGAHLRQRFAAPR